MPAPAFPSLHVDLDRVRARRGVKWTKHDDALAAWVADMDFDPPEVVTAAIRDLLDRGDLGYRVTAGEVEEAFAAWQARHHGWCPDAGRVRVFSTALHGLETILWLNTEPGDGVVVFPPIYHPFLHAIRDSGRRRVEVPLDPGEWRLDPERLEAAIDEGTRLILLCNPHNPTGRVFRREELSAVADVAERHDLLVVSDEIWADITYGATHLPSAIADERFAGRLVTISSASKAFNLAGLRCAVLHVDHVPTNEQFAAMPGHLLGSVGTPAIAATLAAWQDGEPWLDAARRELSARRTTLTERIAAEMPQVGFDAPEGTYLAFLDLRRTDLGDSAADRLRDDHGLALSEGEQFGDAGRGWVRLNFATTEPILELLVDRLSDAVRASG